MNLLEILNFSKEYLQKYSFSKPRLESEKLIAAVLKLDRITLYAYFDMELTTEQKDTIKKYLREMARGRIGFDELIEKKGDLELDTKNYKEENYDLLKKSIEYLEKHQVPNARLDAEYIFAHILKVSRVTLTLNLNKKIEEEDKNRIREMLVARGKERKPLQYPFKVDERVLIPRADTEILLEQCKYLVNELPSPKIMDIGTGSGAIAISLGKELPNAHVLGLDISEGALEVATQNRDMNEATNVKFLKSDVFSILRDEKYKNVKFNLIVSNPPYIPTEEYEELMPEVLKYEPKNALTDNGDGYYFYEKISKEAKEFLTKDAGRYVEIQAGLGKTQYGCIPMAPHTAWEWMECYGGIDRVVIGKRREEN